ncbi:MAG: hypothetical protein HS132_03075 [Planctomycetia bacterium]|nr:hypothetical protein [Planctomycetia bacterium]
MRTPFMPFFNMLETGIDKQAFFNIADFERNSIFSGNPGIMSNDGIIKSVYNAFKALSVLQGKQENEITNRLKADIASEDGFVAAIASQTKDNRKVRMLISNYIPSNRMLKNAFPQKPIHTLLNIEKYRGK